MKELAKALGLSADASKEEIFKAAGEMVLAGKASKEQLSAITKGLSKHGLKLDQGSLVKTEPTGTQAPNVNDSPEVVELKKRLSANEFETGKSKLSSATELAQKYITEGKVPKALEVKLTQLLSIAGRSESLALSVDGSELVKNTFDTFDALKGVLDSVAGFSERGLSTAQGDVEKKEKDEALSYAQKVARRATGKKEPAAATK